MTREEAIEVLENGEWWEELTEWYMIVHPEHDKLHDAVDMAISAIRQQGQERNAPLTLDELREMDGEPVFLVDLVHKSDPKVPDLWGGWIVFTKHDQNGFIPRGGGFFSNDGYGKTWLSYRQKPEEVQK